MTENTNPEVTVKPLSKKARSVMMFNDEVERFKAGEFATKRNFRKLVMDRYQQELDVSLSAAATMYNEAKNLACAADPTLVLGRDPKKEKPEVQSTGKRGRPAKKVVVDNVTEETASAETTTVVIDDAVASEAAEQAADISSFEPAPF